MTKRLILTLAFLAASLSPVGAVTPDDFVAIKQLYSAYALAQDGGDASAMAALFAPGGTIADAATHHAPQAAAKAAVALVGEDHRWGWDRHMLTNIRVTGTKAGCYLLLINSKPNPGMIGYGKTGFYDDALIKTGQGWRFASREIWMDGEAGNPHTR